MGRVLRPSVPPIAPPAAPSRGLARINVSGVDPRGPLAAVQDRIDGAGKVSSITGLYQLLADLQHAGPCAPAATLDLIGPSTGHGLLQLGSSVIDASVPAVLDLFEWIGHERVLPRLGVRELRLIGCRTAIEPAAHDTMRRLAELVGVPVTGTTTLVYRDSPVEMRARLLGVLSVCIGTGPIGFVYLGFLAEAFTPRAGTIALAVQGLLAMLLTRRYWAPLFRS